MRGQVGDRHVAGEQHGHDTAAEAGEQQQPADALERADEQRVDAGHRQAEAREEVGRPGEIAELALPGGEEQPAHHHPHEQESRVAQAIARRFPELAAVAVAELHARQVDWCREQAESYQAYRRANGEPAFTTSGAWPVRRSATALAEVTTTLEIGVAVAMPVASPAPVDVPLPPGSDDMLF